MVTRNGVPLGADVCDVPLGHDAAVRCQLHVGHGGTHAHRTRSSSGLVVARWPDPPAAVCRDLGFSRSAAR